MAIIFGFFCGAIIGSQLWLSISLLDMVNKGFYLDDWIFHDTLWACFFGVPVGGFTGIGLSIFLIKRNIHISRIFIIFIVVALLSIYLCRSLDQKLRPALVQAAQFNQLSKIKLAIRNGDNLNVKDINDATALMEASRNNRITIVKALMEGGADINAKMSDGRTALMEAASQGHTDTVKVLIEGGADVNSVTNEGSTALIEASIFRNDDSVKTLVKAGANVNAMNDRGMTALMLATNYNRADSVRILREAGAKK
ncbi:ankyrin repeat domain-containing protein [Microcoleus sp. herbarium14]|uniref:ankyrin repeat domain-containing protein n=1 Tax=Microcoleus sp. herbarium14 TaxID=3055439 RepID=UPI002FD11C96